MAKKSIFEDERWAAEFSSWHSYLQHSDSPFAKPTRNFLAILKQKHSYEEISFTEEQIGGEFREALRTGEYKNDPEQMFLWLFRYLAELNARGAPLEELLHKGFQVGSEDGSSHLKNVLAYWRQNTERLIIRDLLGRQEVKNLQTLEFSVEKARATAENIEKFNSSVAATLADAKFSMDKWQENLGFVRLAVGFRHMRKQKGWQAVRTLALIAILAISILAIPATEYLALTSGRLKADISSLYLLAPIVAVEMLLIYFFRLVFSRYKSIEAQKLQLDHRIALLQFIQRYSSFREKKAGLEKFEELIFGGIVASEEAIPSMFDGLEHVAKILQGKRSGT